MRRLLLENCNLHTVLDLPGGAFQGAGVKTVILFFEKGKPTKKVWFYQLNLDRNLGKTNPLSEKDLEDFLKLQKTKADSENSWSVDVSEITGEGRSLGRSKATEKGATLKSDFEQTYDLSIKNPNKGGDVALREPKKILEEILKNDKATVKILSQISKII